MVKSGRWAVTLNAGGDAQVVELGPQDTLSVPPGAWRAITLLDAEAGRAATPGTGELLVVNGGDGRVRLEWAPEVVGGGPSTPAGCSTPTATSLPSPCWSPRPRTTDGREPAIRLRRGLPGRRRRSTRRTCACSTTRSREAAGRGARLVVLPELAACGYVLRDAAEARAAAERSTRPTVALLQRAVGRAGVRHRGRRRGAGRATPSTTPRSWSTAASCWRRYRKDPPVGPREVGVHARGRGRRSSSTRRRGGSA